MSKYWDRWSIRPDAVDCFDCTGDPNASCPVDPVPCAECAFTGLDPIPWSELFTHGRIDKSWMQRNL